MVKTSTFVKTKYKVEHIEASVGMSDYYYVCIICIFLILPAAGSNTNLI